ncbi:MAG TPA: DUF2752 domain-containing protein, partial [Pyrinomonadaceae bacterium]|nr:DUF2752 domain-containing protein [Pyrinomonadaceae bacterium]
MTEVFNRPLTVALIWLSLALGAIYLYLFEPGKTGLFLRCPFRALTGFTCPGCGSTRSLHHLLHGDFSGAFQLNPLFVIALPFLLYALIRYSNSVIRQRPIKGNQLQPAYIWLLFGTVLSF